MRRPTIGDLAEAAGVSIATVNRVLAGSAGVRTATKLRVEEAAATIGFYGLGAIKSRIASGRSKYLFGFLLLQPHRQFYQNVAKAIRNAAAEISDADVEVRIDFLEELSPQTTAARLQALAHDCDAVGVTSAVHPLVTQAVDDVQSSGVPVFALIAQLSATGTVHYVGLDNWKVGRTAAWAFHHICERPGKLAILVGNPRYRNHEMNESGFRSYFREFAPEFLLLEPLSTFEQSAVAEEMTEKLLKENKDLAGLYVSGGGITGALAALRGSGRAGKLVVVGYELMPVTRDALLDGTLTFVISNPLARLASEAIRGMIAAISNRSAAKTTTIVLPFEIYTRENL